MKSTIIVDCEICENECDTLMIYFDRSVSPLCEICFNEIPDNSYKLVRLVPMDTPVNPKFDEDIAYICYTLKTVMNGHFPVYWKLLAEETMIKLFNGIRRRDISEYIQIFSEGVKTSLDLVNEFKQRRQEQLERRILTEDDKRRKKLRKLTVKMLKDEMTKLNIQDQTGKKADLIERIMSTFSEKVE